MVLVWRAGTLPHYHLEEAADKLSYFLAADLEKSIEANGLHGLYGLYLLEIER